MTANIFAPLLDGVPRFNHCDDYAEFDPQGEWVVLRDVLAALAAAYPADLAEAGKRAAYIANECQQAAKVMEETGTFPTGQAIFRDASAQITALLARIAAQQAQIKGLEAKARESAMQELASLGQAQEAYEAQVAAETALAAERAKVAKLVEALRFYADDANWWRNGPLDASSPKFTGGPARAAITEAGQ